ncbi:MAG TPA: TerB family tellurite resistance protein [Acetobacteraceae bacterium]|jgi:DnaJ like chaperone protein|nr:TerB family tellurite resistance protein [Acetobacteraceae bacterium]
MSYWGKVIGGVTGFAMGGPLGAVVGAALGHAADTGAIPNMRLPFGAAPPGMGWSPARVAALLGRKDQLFAISVVVLSAKLAKCDGAVKRAEIDAFKRSFRIPPQSVHDIGRLFDQARDSTDGFEAYADQLGEAFTDNRGMLEDVLASLFAIARADGPLNQAEHAFLSRVHRGFELDQVAWDHARGAAPRPPASDAPDPYGVLGVTRGMNHEDLRAAWKQLMRENHPDSLAARGVPAEFIARASDKVARINAAWDQIKRERGL